MAVVVLLLHLLLVMAVVVLRLPPVMVVCPVMVLRLPPVMVVCPVTVTTIDPRLEKVTMDGSPQLVATEAPMVITESPVATKALTTTTGSQTLTAITVPRLEKVKMAGSPRRLRAETSQGSVVV